MWSVVPGALLDDGFKIERLGTVEEVGGACVVEVGGVTEWVWPDDGGGLRVCSLVDILAREVVPLL